MVKLLIVKHDRRDRNHFWIQVEECLLPSKETTEVRCVPPSGSPEDPCGRGHHVGTRFFVPSVTSLGVSYDSSSFWAGLELTPTGVCKKRREEKRREEKRREEKRREEKRREEKRREEKRREEKRREDQELVEVEDHLVRGAQEMDLMIGRRDEESGLNIEDQYVKGVSFQVSTEEVDQTKK
ncbi:hypothetical protein CRENBAI_009549 [Crenichthys baileyi]|uniref:Uncharacterized protein n=1 Tax=Crenichthys baileyi TaxID=28760 RepID=A0AAV9RMD2_9TELE